MIEYGGHPTAQRVLEDVAADVAARCDADAVAVGHRLGPLRVGEVALVAAVSAAHRREAFEAAALLVDGVDSGCQCGSGRSSRTAPANGWPAPSVRGRGSPAAGERWQHVDLPGAVQRALPTARHLVHEERARREHVGEPRTVPVGEASTSEATVAPAGRSRAPGRHRRRPVPPRSSAPRRACSAADRSSSGGWAAGTTIVDAVEPERLAHVSPRQACAISSSDPPERSRLRRSVSAGGEEAVAHLAVGRQAGPVTVAAEGARHGRHDAQLPPTVPVLDEPGLGRRRPAGGPGRPRSSRGSAVSRCRISAAVTMPAAPGALRIERHLLDETQLVAMRERAPGEGDGLVVVDAA